MVLVLGEAIILVGVFFFLAFCCVLWLVAGGEWGQVGPSDLAPGPSGAEWGQVTWPRGQVGPSDLAPGPGVAALGPSGAK